MERELVCTSEETDSKICPPDLSDVNAKGACERIREFERLNPDINGFAKDIIENINPVNWFKSSAESVQKTMNKISTDLRTSSVAKQMSECNNKIIQTQSNIIEGVSPECINSLKDILTPDELRKYVSGSMTDIQQINTANAQNICRINLALEALTKMDASIENSALQKALNEAKGLMSNSESNQDICNDISLKMSACKYISQKQCCANKVNQNQSNVLRAQCTGGQIARILQSNTADAQNTCDMSSQASISDEMKASIKNTISQDAVNKSEGLTMSFLLIFLIIFLVIVGGPVGITMFTGAKILKYIGPILFIIGVVFMALWLISRKPEQTIANKPFSGCKDTKALEKLSRGKFSDVKSRVAQDDVIGYDFFIDLGDKEKGSDIDPLTISDDQLGSVFYLTQIASSPICTDSADKDKMSVISYKKGSQNLRFLVAGCVSLFVGLCMIAYSFFSRDTSKINPTNSISNPTKPPIKPPTNPPTKPPTKPTA